METDASEDAVGAVLCQQHEDGMHPVAFFSHKYIPAERNYSTGDKELLAIFKSCMKWRPYLDGNATTVHTDHKPLTSLHTQPYLSKRQARWMERLGELALTIKYKPGPLNVVADTLSRRPQADQHVSPYLADADASRVARWLRQRAP